MPAFQYTKHFGNILYIRKLEEKGMSSDEPIETLKKRLHFCRLFLYNKLAREARQRLF